MTPKFKSGDIVVWELTDIHNKKTYLLVTQFCCINKEYYYNQLNSDLILRMELNMFEKSIGPFKETRLITNEEKLEIL